ncbi:peptidylprolyl isomerase (plasmid) [Paraclostridium ghonii]|uniref:peptidylprolyl isomerase n=1 Tax=Paraclostridium ghonii TaxID=29358 RepID=UPI00202CEF15|nr:peptidylprolyl isomerase [Paeniclostridium ghonii]MCM0166568.1 peptidylprolyl isomerase [Paeniclostridium ghonii]
MKKKVLATIGKKEITNIDIENTLKSLPQYQAMQLNTEEGKQSLLENLVNQELFYLEAKEENLHKDEIFKTEVKKMEEEILKIYAINKTLKSVELNDNEITKFYEVNKDKFIKPETASAKHILVDSEEKANELLNKINNTEISFEEAAKEHSTCPSKDSCGDLGTFPKGQMDSEFEEAVFSMKKGEVRGPVKTQFGYHLIKLEGSYESCQSELDEVKDEISKNLIIQKQQEVYSSKVNELRSKYNNILKLND